ncbi:hypothetical protein A1D31_38720 [Bradyrhizobium liaoningense]|nr:hypothetical protein A1D31_38720 [Bradyrhizobium liaoningense]
MTLSPVEGLKPQTPRIELSDSFVDAVRCVRSPHQLTAESFGTIGFREDIGLDRQVRHGGRMVIVANVTYRLFDSLEPPAAIHGAQLLKTNFASLTLSRLARGLRPWVQPSRNTKNPHLH